MSIFLYHHIPIPSLVLKVPHNLNFYFLSPTNFLQTYNPPQVHMQILRGSPNSLPLDLVLALFLACTSGFTHKYLLLNFHIFFKGEDQILSNTSLFSLCPGLLDLFPCQNSLLLLPNRLPVRNLPGLNKFPYLTKWVRSSTPKS